MWLILATCEKLCWQDFAIEVSDFAFVVCGARRPERFAVHCCLEFEERAAEPDSAGKAMSRLVGNRNLDNEFIVLHIERGDGETSRTVLCLLDNVVHGVR